MQKILITGGTGTIGSFITKQLLQEGNEVIWLTRSKKPNTQIHQIIWDFKSPLPSDAIPQVDIIIHLAGSSIAGKRWNEQVKKEIYDSRIQTTNWLYEYCKNARQFPEKFISASAIGYYGVDTGDQWLTEKSNFGTDFLSVLTQDWEKAAFRFKSENTEVICLRTGIVLSEKGGALEQMITPFKIGIGAALGNGKQYMSWIHEDDVLAAYLYAISHLKTGAYNLTAPNPVTNIEFSSILANKLKTRLILPKVPAFALRWMLGGIASYVLGSSRVSPQLLIQEGFHFKYTELNEALYQLISKKM